MNLPSNPMTTDYKERKEEPSNAKVDELIEIFEEYWSAEADAYVIRKHELPNFLFFFSQTMNDLHVAKYPPYMKCEKCGEPMNYPYSYHTCPLTH